MRSKTSTVSGLGKRRASSGRAGAAPAWLPAPGAQELRQNVERSMKANQEKKKLRVLSCSQTPRNSLITGVQPGVDQTLRTTCRGASSRRGDREEGVALFQPPPPPQGPGGEQGPRGAPRGPVPGLRGWDLQAGWREMVWGLRRLPLGRHSRAQGRGRAFGTAGGQVGEHPQESWLCGPRGVAASDHRLELWGRTGPVLPGRGGGDGKVLPSHPQAAARRQAALGQELESVGPGSSPARGCDST